MLTISSFTLLKQTSLCKYILPLRDVEIHITRVNGLSVQTVRRIRILFKDNQPVEIVSLGKGIRRVHPFKFVPTLYHCSPPHFSSLTPPSRLCPHIE